jgi:putative ABC transport system permease protein
VLFGLAPAMQSSREEVTQSLKDGGRGTVGRSGRLLRRGLIVAEVALALMLLTGGGLLLQTFVRLQNTDMGFNPENILVGAVFLPRTSYDTREKHRAFYDQMLEKISALPGVEKAAIASVLPLSGDSDTNFAIDGRAAPRSVSETPITWYRQVSAGYFDTMGMKLRRGRSFDAGEAAPSVVVNETMAAKYFPGEDPVGQRIRLGQQSPWFTIIGIVGDAKVRGAGERTVVETFVPYWQLTEPGMIAILKARTDPASLTNPLRQAMASIDRNVPVSGVGTLSDIVRESIGQPRFFALLAGAFAALALVLAGIGMYGVMAYSVAQRTTEIGVRVALGATPGEVFKLIVGDGLKLTAIGVGLGVGGAMLVAKGLSTLLFGVTPWDPMTLAATAGMLLAVAATACFVPARRATRVDAMVALRAE